MIFALILQNLLTLTPDYFIVFLPLKFDLYQSSLEGKYEYCRRKQIEFLRELAAFYGQGLMKG